MDLFQLPTLLIISDNPPVCYWLKKHLEKQFYIIGAQKKDRSLEIVQNTTLDFIIIDSTFEECNALELCRQLRRINLLTPIFLITGRLKKNYRKSALDAGVSDFLSESLDEKELETRITRGLKTAEARNKVAGLSSHIPPAKADFSSDYLKNKDLLQTEVLRLLSNAKEHKLALTIIIIRIDHFTKLPEKEILLPFSKLLGENITEKDLVIPMNNGQFILLVSQNLQWGEKTAVKLREKIDQYPFETEKGPLHITATFALSDLGNSEKSFNEIIDSTIKTLKQAGTITNTILPLEKRNN